MNRSDGSSAAIRLLHGLEKGGVTPFSAGEIAATLDPVLLHVIVRYLREVYPASNPAATAVLDRVVALTSTSPALVAKAKEGERDPVSAWFASAHSFREFRGRGEEMIALIVEKLES